MKLYLFFFFFLILLASPVLAAQNDLSKPINVAYDLNLKCFNNGTFCSSSAVCTLTYEDPDGIIVIDNATLTNQVNFHNITITQSQNSKFGTWWGTQVCFDPSGDIIGSGPDTFPVEISGDGMGFRAFPFELSIFVLGLILIVTGKLKEELRMMKHVGSFIVMIMGVLTLYPGFSFVNFSTLIGKVIGFGGIGMGFYFLIEDSFSRSKQDEYYAPPTPQQEEEGEEDGRFHGN